jgi:hypothetical protein
MEEAARAAVLPIDLADAVLLRDAPVLLPEFEAVAELTQNVAPRRASRRSVVARRVKGRS